MCKYTKCLLAALCLAWMLVIWQFSLAPATESAADSAGVREAVNEVLGKLGLSFRFTPHTVRKTAHFAEFFVLGVLAYFTAERWRLPMPYFTAAVLPVFTGAVDELIQRFVPGRGSAFADVLLDTAGGICGIAVSCLAFLGICAFRARRCSRKRPKPKNEP